MLITFLRWLKWQLLRAREGFFGANNVRIKRLVKAGRVTIGPHSLAYCAPTIRDYMLDNTRIDIGDYCSLSASATIHIGGKHAIDAVTTYPHRILWQMEGAGRDGFPTPTGDSWIGSDVWFGDQVLMLSGIRVGHGVIAGTGAVITKDVPDYAIIGGNPARVLRYRFTEEQIAALLEIAWWDWPEEEVRRAVPLLTSTNVDDFIAYGRARLRGENPEVPPFDGWRFPLATS